MVKRARDLALVAVALFSFSASAMLAQQTPPPPQGQNGAPPGARGPRGPMPKPVNLKVLPKDISTEDLIRIMRGFATQLGVHCEFCHVQDPETRHMNFASDEKPTKNIARTMMLMTNDINGKYLAKVDVPEAKPAEKEATCGTCHRGMPIPEVFTPAPRTEAPPKS